VSDNSAIEWTDSTWNPVTGCTEVTPGCDNCYAKTFAERWRGTPGHYFEHGFDVVLRPDKLGLPLRWRKPRRIFVNSMSDLFHDSVPDEYIARAWQVMGAASQHTYQILTKRHGRMKSWVNRWYSGNIPEPYDVRPVPGYPDYSVTTHGEVLGKRADTRGGLAQDVGGQGHRRVPLYREGSPRGGERELVHRLVLTAFVRSPHAGEQACHRNGDPSDNRLSNLYWGTQSDNWKDRIRHGNGRSHSKLNAEQVAEIRERCALGQSASSLAPDYGISDTQIRNIVRGDHWATSQPAPAARKPCRAVLDCVWLGVSVEDQKRAELRIPALIDTPAAVRWLSCEPLLAAVDITRWLPAPMCEACRADMGEPMCDPCYKGYFEAPRLDWVVVGGESGPRSRPMQPDWARALRDQCVGAGIPYFFKQTGTALARDLGLRGKGDDWNDLPAEFRIRDYPQQAVAHV
jgi:protein gp37